MIMGLDKFREHFTGYSDRYVLIGGAASDLVMDAAGATFRATKDLDIVLCIEALDSAFAKKDYPAMLELFSRIPDTLVLGDDSHITSPRYSLQ